MSRKEWIIRIATLGAAVILTRWAWLLSNDLYRWWHHRGLTF